MIVRGNAIASRMCSTTGLLTRIRHWRILSISHAIHRNQRFHPSGLTALLTDDEYGELQIGLVSHPSAGAIIPHSGGLRKIRWSMGGRGKRGGVRVIYYWVVSEDQILMLFMYPKSEKDDLTPQQLKALREIVEKEFK